LARTRPPWPGEGARRARLARLPAATDRVSELSLAR
jgi:hypothetical protein